MRKVPNERRKTQARVTAILTIALMLAGGAATFGAVSAIGSVQLATPTALIAR